MVTVLADTTAGSLWVMKIGQSSDLVCNLASLQTVWLIIIIRCEVRMYPQDMRIRTILSAERADKRAVSMHPHVCIRSIPLTYKRATHALAMAAMEATFGTKR